mgnify:FL=1
MFRAESACQMVKQLEQMVDEDELSGFEDCFERLKMEAALVIQEMEDFLETRTLNS